MNKWEKTVVQGCHKADAKMNDKATVLSMLIDSVTDETAHTSVGVSKHKVQDMKKKGNPQYWRNSKTIRQAQTT